MLGARCNHRKAARFDFTLAQLALCALTLRDSGQLGTNRFDQFEPCVGRLDAMIAVKLDERGDVPMRHHRNHDPGLQTGGKRDVESVPVRHARQVGHPIGDAGQIRAANHVTG